MRVKWESNDNDERSAMPSGSTMSLRGKAYQWSRMVPFHKGNAFGQSDAIGRMWSSDRNRGTREPPRLCNRPCQFCSREPYGVCICMDGHHTSPKTVCLNAQRVQMLPPFGVVVFLIQGTFGRNSDISKGRASSRTTHFWGTMQQMYGTFEGWFSP